jgi:hypothetical protein
MNFWGTIFLVVVGVVAVKYRKEFFEVVKDWTDFLNDKRAWKEREAKSEKQYDLEKTKFEAGAFFDWNNFIRNLLIFSIILVGLFVVTFSQFSNQILQDNEVSSSMDFSTDIDVQFDGYFTKEITKKVVKIDPSCQDTFKYLEHSYALPQLPSTTKRLEQINDEGWTQYYTVCLGDKEFPEEDFFVKNIRYAINTSDMHQQDKEYFDALFRERIGEHSCNTTLVFYKKNLEDCEREIIEVENPKQFIPTNLTVNGISVSGNGTGNLGNLVGMEAFSILSDIHWNFEEHFEKYERWRN